MNILYEFLEDLKKQCIVLMGLPAAGKSTFINNEIQTYIPGFKNYKVSASDNLLKGLQFQVARQHYDKLYKNTIYQDDANEIRKEIAKLKFGTRYVSNRGKMTEIPITYDWWEENKDKGFDNYWKTFYKGYYATYFDIRDVARGQEKQLFRTKVKESANLIVVDSTAANPNSIMPRLEAAKENDFHNTIIYLEIDPELAVVRDRYREDTEGRGVGEKAILGYAKKMDVAYKYYQNEAKKAGPVDRIIHFIWKPSGDSPIKGTWKLISDKRYSLKRKKKSKQ